MQKIDIQWFTGELKNGMMKMEAYTFVERALKASILKIQWHSRNQSDVVGQEQTLQHYYLRKQHFKVSIFQADLLVQRWFGILFDHGCKLQHCGQKDHTIYWLP